MNIPRPEKIQSGQVMKITVYLKSGRSVTFPGRYVVTGSGDSRAEGFATVPPLEIPVIDWGSVDLVMQEPWEES